MAKLKVLEVIRQGQIGGGESHLLDLIYFLNKEKIEPVCLSFSDGEMIKRLTQMGVTCHVINSQKPFDIKIQRQIIKLIQDEHIQLVHAHGSRAASNILYPTRKPENPYLYKTALRREKLSARSYLLLRQLLRNLQNSSLSDFCMEGSSTG